MDDLGYLAHHGIKGQKWGNRRYQDANGQLTPEGSERYNKKRQKYQKKFEKAASRSDKWYDEAKRDSRKASRLFQTDKNRQRYAQESDNEMRRSNYYARKAVRAFNKIDKLDNKVMGMSLMSLNPEMVNKDYELIERNNNYQMYHLNNIYSTWYDDKRQ